jgi:hypothetical protein
VDKSTLRPPVLSEIGFGRGVEDPEVLPGMSIHCDFFGLLGVFPVGTWVGFSVGFDPAFELAV